MSLLVLPPELILHIFDFLIKTNNKLALFRQALTLGSICNKISKQESIWNYLEDFWKSVLQHCVVSGEKELSTLEDALKKMTYRRVFCLLSAYRCSFGRFSKSKSETEEYRVVLIGCGGVGKSSILNRYVQGVFISVYDPSCSSDDYRKFIEIDGKRIVLELMDSYGQEEYSAMRDQNIRMSDVIVHVVSTDITMEDVDSFVYQILRAKDEDSVPIVFAINKIDLGDDFPMEYINRAVKNNGATNYSIVKTSAKTGEGVTELFDEVIRRARIGVINITDIKSILLHDKRILKASGSKKKCLLM